MDHMLTGQKTSLTYWRRDFSRSLIIINLYLFKRGSLFVKDMVVIKENNESDNGTITR